MPKIMVSLRSIAFIMLHVEADFGIRHLSKLKLTEYRNFSHFRQFATLGIFQRNNSIPWDRILPDFPR
jgi:hypothetical protein